jgi:hypothetical protein
MKKVIPCSLHRQPTTLGNSCVTCQTGGPRCPSHLISQCWVGSSHYIATHRSAYRDGKQERVAYSLAGWWKPEGFAPHFSVTRRLLISIFPPGYFILVLFNSGWAKRRPPDTCWIPQDDLRPDGVRNVSVRTSSGSSQQAPESDCFRETAKPNWPSSGSLPRSRTRC